MEHKQNAENIVQNHLYWAVASGFIPIPLVDLVAVTAIQADMIRQLCTEYNISYNESEGKALVTALSGSVLSRLGASLVKSVPLLGSIVGGLSMPLLSGATTYAVGQVFINHFEQGGDLANLQIAAFIDFYEDMLDKGQEVAGEVVEKHIRKSETPENIRKKLVELENLKEKGVLTDKEFERIRKRLMKALE